MVAVVVAMAVAALVVAVVAAVAVVMAAAPTLRAAAVTTASHRSHRHRHHRTLVFASAFVEVCLDLFLGPFPEHFFFDLSGPISCTLLFLTLFWTHILLIVF